MGSGDYWLNVWDLGEWASRNGGFIFCCELNVVSLVGALNSRSILLDITQVYSESYKAKTKEALGFPLVVPRENSLPCFAQSREHTQSCAPSPTLSPLQPLLPSFLILLPTLNSDPCCKDPSDYTLPVGSYRVIIPSPDVEPTHICGIRCSMQFWGLGYGPLWRSC